MLEEDRKFFEDDTEKLKGEDLLSMIEKDMDLVE